MHIKDNTPREWPRVCSVCGRGDDGADGWAYDFASFKDAHRNKKRWRCPACQPEKSTEMHPSRKDGKPFDMDTFGT